MKPSLGRIVLLSGLPPTMNNGSDTAPAVITRVWSDSLINVRVLLDGVDSSPARTSVTLHESYEAYLAERERRAADPALTHAGDYLGAYWPPRV